MPVYDTHSARLACEPVPLHRRRNMMSGAVLFASVFGFVVTSELALRILEPSFVSSAPESRDLPAQRPAVASSIAMFRLALRPAGRLWVDVLARNLSRRHFEQLSLTIFKCVTVM
jgi:hypothetical protein